MPVQDGSASATTLGARIEVDRNASGAAGTKVEFQVKKQPPARVPFDFAQPVGLPVEIAPERALPGAKLHLSFDARKDLLTPPQTSERPTPQNAFIAVYNTDVGAWIPLETEYLPQAHELVATAPHFSLFARFVVTPGKHVAHIGSAAVTFVTDGITRGTAAFARLAAAFASEAWQFGFNTILGRLPEDRKAECPPQAKQAPGYSVAIEHNFGGGKDVRACVVDEDSAGQTRRWLRVENPVPLGFYLFPDTVLDVGWNAYDDKNLGGDPLMSLWRLLFSTGGLSLMTGPGTAELGILPDTRTPFNVEMSVDELELAIRAVTAILSILPQTAEAKVTLAQVTRRAEFRVALSQSGTLTKTATFSRRITTLRGVLRQTLVGKKADEAMSLIDGLECLHQLTEGEKLSVESLLAVVTQCAQVVAKGLNPSGELVTALAGLGQVLTLPAELAAALSHGFDKPVLTVTGPIVPTLGREWAPSQEGYGQVRPATIFNGGSPSGLVTDVKWESWGGPQATAQGLGLWVPEDKSVAEGSRLPVAVVAFNLGLCEGKLMYKAINWHFPQRGETFNPAEYIDICTGDYVG